MEKLQRYCNYMLVLLSFFYSIFVFYKDICKKNAVAVLLPFDLNPEKSFSSGAGHIFVGSETATTICGSAVRLRCEIWTFSEEEEEVEGAKP